MFIVPRTILNVKFMTKKQRGKGVPYKGFLNELKIYRKLHFQAKK